MTCVICKHSKSFAGKVTVTLERDSMTLVFKGVPADVCRHCGEQYVSQEVTATLLQTAEESAKAGIQVDIRYYAPLAHSPAVKSFETNGSSTQR